jgi:excisionase family DNA binding protein
MDGKNSPRGRLLTIREACPLLGYRPQSVYNSISGGTGELAQLPYYRVGRSIRFAEEDINAFLERRRVEPRTGMTG